MSHRIYPYVGTKEIREAANTQPSGTPILSIEDLWNWISTESTERRQDGSWIATFTISVDLVLCVAPRRSEHVACASGGPVLSAGEITFDRKIDVIEISNQSTGFCPEPESWQAVEAALELLELKHPGRFTLPIVFRRCPECKERNLVKDLWFFCEVCENELPADWNFDEFDNDKINKDDLSGNRF